MSASTAAAFLGNAFRVYRVVVVVVELEVRLRAFSPSMGVLFVKIEEA
jgi:hypothetical protein